MTLLHAPFDDYFSNTGNLFAGHPDEIDALAEAADIDICWRFWNLHWQNLPPGEVG